MNELDRDVGIDDITRGSRSITMGNRTAPADGLNHFRSRSALPRGQWPPLHRGH
ncbi:hypothetical protein [Saccharothrix stipae]